MTMKRTITTGMAVAYHGVIGVLQLEHFPPSQQPEPQSSDS